MGSVNSDLRIHQASWEYILIKEKDEKDIACAFFPFLVNILLVSKLTSMSVPGKTTQAGFGIPAVVLYLKATIWDKNLLRKF